MLPPEFQSWISSHFLHKRSPAYLIADRQARLIDWGGNLEFYGVRNLKQGKPVDEQIHFLEGLLPLRSAEMFLPFVQTDSGVYMDIHLFSGDNDCVLLLDATKEEIQQSLMQQKANDLNILRDRVFRKLEEEMGPKSYLSREGVVLREQGERRELTVLNVEIRGLTEYSEAVSPQDVFEALSRCYRTIIQPILDEAGVVMHMIGDSLAALFGVLPTTGLPSVLAFRAASRIQESYISSGRNRTGDASTSLDLTIGLASGPVCVGILQEKERHWLSAIGFPVSQAARLRQYARPGEIVVDAHTQHILTQAYSVAGSFRLLPQEGKNDPFFRYRIEFV